MASELLHQIEAAGREKGLDPEVIIQALEEAYAAAARKFYHANEEFGARFNRETGEFSVFSKQMIVEDDDLADPATEITLEDAQLLSPDAELGGVIETALKHIDAPLSRIAAQAAKQVIYQKVKEAERELIWREYGDRIGELFTGQVKRFDRGDMILDLGRTEGVILRREQSRAEHYNPGDRIRAVLVHVERLGKGPQLLLSRGSELLVKKLFEMEVPEIYDGTVSIVSVARDSGERSKVAVRSKDRDVDAVGACVGMKGSRVQAVIRELRGEKIDIVQFDDDPNNYVRNALNPAAINRVGVQDYEDRVMEVIVAEDQLSLAIGKRGQNVRLAGKLVGWNLDIKSEFEKKAEMEAEMERMAAAADELGSLPGISEPVSTLLLDAGFRTIEEVSLASLEDLTGIEGIDEDTAIDLHDAAETAFEEQVARAAEEAAAEAERVAAEEEQQEQEDAAGEDSTSADATDFADSPEADEDAQETTQDEHEAGETVQEVVTADAVTAETARMLADEDALASGEAPLEPAQENADPETPEQERRTE